MNIRDELLGIAAQECRRIKDAHNIAGIYIVLVKEVDGMAHVVDAKLWESGLPLEDVLKIHVAPEKFERKREH